MLGPPFLLVAVTPMARCELHSAMSTSAAPSQPALPPMLTFRNEFRLRRSPTFFLRPFWQRDIHAEVAPRCGLIACVQPFALQRSHLGGWAASWASKKLSGPHMSVLRRFPGCARYKHTVLTGHQVCIALRAPSLECLVSQRRRSCLAQLLRPPAEPLRLFFACTSTPRASLPWMKSTPNGSAAIEDFACV